MTRGIRVALVAFLASAFVPSTCLAQSCSTDCPLGSYVEDEPVCGPGYIDSSSCQTLSPIPLSCGVGDDITVCGTFGFFAPTDSTEYADFDAYSFNVPDQRSVTLCLCGPEAGSPQIEIMRASSPCNFHVCYAAGGGGEPACCTVVLQPGVYWVYVSDVYAVPCGSPYVLRIEGLGCATVGTQPAKWWTVKSRYQ